MSKRIKLNMTDASFLLLENRRTPQHVGTCGLFKLPEGADETSFLHDITDCLKSDDDVCRPFGDVLETGRLGVVGPCYWKRDEALDLEYHIRHSALPKPGRYRELFALISRLHSTLLGRSRPLWEMHLIEGLQDGQFAVYQKAHHSTVDGMRGTQLIQQMYSTDPSEMLTVSPFSKEAERRFLESMPKKKKKKPVVRDRDLKAISEMLSEQFQQSLNLTKMLRDTVGVWTGQNTRLSAPWNRVPKTPINTQIDGSRRFVAQSWPISRIKALAKAIDGTVNDVVLAMCSGALRQYLLEFSELPDESLKATAPVSLRLADDTQTSNAFSFIVTDLSTNIKDPEKRVRAIRDSMREGKQHLEQLSRTQIELYTALSQTPMLLLSLMGMASKLPATNIIISNIPGPSEQLYLNGAPMVGLYPVSIVMDGWALNITLQSNYDRLDFGIIACRKSVPNVQRLIDFLDDELNIMEVMAGINSNANQSAKTKQKKAATARKKSSARKAPARQKTTAKKDATS